MSTPTTPEEAARLAKNARAILDRYNEVFFPQGEEDEDEARP